MEKDQVSKFFDSAYEEYFRYEGIFNFFPLFEETKKRLSETKNDKIRNLIIDFNVLIPEILKFFSDFFKEFEIREFGPNDWKKSVDAYKFLIDSDGSHLKNLENLEPAHILNLGWVKRLRFKEDDLKYEWINKMIRLLSEYYLKGTRGEKIG